MDLDVKTVAVTTHPTDSEAIVVFTPGSNYVRTVKRWWELLDIIGDHESKLVIDPAHADEIIKVLNLNQPS